MKILALTKYGRLGASSRLRFYQYLPYLQHVGINVQVEALISDDALVNRYESGTYRRWGMFSAYLKRIWSLVTKRQFDLIWIEKEALPWFPAWLELRLLGSVPYILDYDDATFHTYDLHTNYFVREIFKKRIDKLMTNARLVICGNSYLFDRAKRAGAKTIHIVPTVVDLSRYRNQNDKQAGALAVKELNVNNVSPPLRIVWIGSPSTVRYLEIIKQPLQRLAKEHDFILRIIGSLAKIEITGIEIEYTTWHEETEIERLKECDIGIMPLYDGPWERGKCGYKLIQYMACCLPVVASLVGVNKEIVDHGRNGFVASNEQGWFESLDKLLGDKSARKRMGMAGLKRVEQSYSIQVAAPKVVESFELAYCRC